MTTHVTAPRWADPGTTGRGGQEHHVRVCTIGEDGAVMLIEARASAPYLSRASLLWRLAGAPVRSLGYVAGPPQSLHVLAGRVLAQRGWQVVGQWTTLARRPACLVRRAPHTRPRRPAGPTDHRKGQD